MQQFIDRAERRLYWAGAALLAASLVVGVAVTLWLVTSVRRLRRYAQQAQAGQALAPPAMPGELGELAHAMDDMRRRLEGREQLEHDVRALTHELKSPLAALRASGELLQDELPAADRQRFFSTARPGSLVKGSGLGLAIARRVAELHGGRLAFAAAGPGLRVTLMLPR